MVQSFVLMLVLLVMEKALRLKKHWDAAKVALQRRFMLLLMHLEIHLNSPGQRNEITQAEALAKNVHNSFIVADKGYDSNAFITNLESKGCEVVIPPKRNRKVQRDYDKHVYKERHMVESFFRPSAKRKT